MLIYSVAVGGVRLGGAHLRLHTGTRVRNRQVYELTSEEATFYWYRSGFRQRMVWYWP
jgi:hypothetical protein